MEIISRTSDYCEGLAIPGMHREDLNKPSARYNPWKRSLKAATRRSHQDSRSADSTFLSCADSYANVSVVHTDYKVKALKLHST